MDIEPLRIEILRHSTYCIAVEEEPDEQPRYHDILKYLQKGEFLEGSEAADRKHLTKLASKFFASGDVFYKRSFNSTLLRCVDAKEIHEGEYGPHMNGHFLSKLDKTKWMQQRHEQLNMIDEKSLQAVCHGQCYQRQVIKAFN
ncbi:uncharacterized protein LOC120295362 [Eucalyptus grandis]|uniref:uncharacterized protein LOC120295362 n=1 Tax=Eucalyptus grandis TaxID=71139 RepID=UPI00192EAD14|nr:uncharacterized protein LOC120295362 [Eucalyptus grandis]